MFDIEKERANIGEGRPCYYERNGELYCRTSITKLLPPPYKPKVLVLRHKWFDLIASGEKKEEYRKYTPRWDRWIFEYGEGGQSIVDFRRGYTKTSCKVHVAGIVITGCRTTSWDGKGWEPYTLRCGDLKRVYSPGPQCRPEWGYEDKYRMIITLGDIVK